MEDLGINEKHIHHGYEATYQLVVQAIGMFIPVPVLQFLINKELNCSV